MNNYTSPDVNVIQELKDIANKLRILSIKATNSSNSGHPTSCVSIAEIMSVLFFHTMRYNVKEPRGTNADRFILSKGHAAPILYAAWAEAGLFPHSELLNLRKINNDLEGHPTPRLNFVDVATGSLGQGLSVACGMAYIGKYIDKIDYKTYCLIGDGESAEGSIWEALSFAGVKKLNNLVAIFDINRLGQYEPTPFGHNMEIYKNRLESFGLNTYVIDGHDVEALCKAFYGASQSTKPTALVCRTLKGKGLPGIEDEENWHSKIMGTKSKAFIETIQALIINEGPPKIAAGKPQDVAPTVDISNVNLSFPPNYKFGEKIVLRNAYGTALMKLAQNNPHVVTLDADMKNSTFSKEILKVDPNRFIECYIAEQNMVGVGIGAACRDRTIAFCSTFAAFFTRAFDQIRMGAVSQTNLNFVGSHCGVSIGPDGPSQMGLEDLAMFRTIPTATVFYPSDAVSTERAVELAANTKGICYVRISRHALNVIYGNNEHFEIGKSHVIRKSTTDKALLIGASITIQESLKAADELAKLGINVRVLDPFTIKPIDKEGIIRNAKECRGRIVVTEDHYPEGGIGEAVMSAVALKRNVIVRHLAIPRVPRSGQPDELLDMFGISTPHIVNAVEEIIKL